ncbi:DUF2510 domain-containing protein [Agromyces sp. NPDC058110]|uniref:DUF2510 domain-containing protein n=1 Tax=Agromyces sp. NPDC058110 TaxID=3346345 RepID=UPI0036D7E9BD
MNSLPPPSASTAPGWYVDPVANDMLRWWDGAEWSETEFKLARRVIPPISAESRRDLLLGPIGRLGSLFNVIMCGVIIFGGLMIALTVTPFGWGLVVAGLVLEVVFVTVAVLVRRFDVPQRVNSLLWPADRSPNKSAGPPE